MNVDASSHVIFILFSPNEQGGGERGGRCQTFSLSYLVSFPCSADHKRGCPSCKVVFRVGKLIR